MLRFAAALHLLTRLMFILAVISAPFFFAVSGLSPAQSLILPGVAVVLGILWAISASGVRCSVCAMKLLVHQPCIKHRKAVRWFGFGYHGTLAMQALFSHRIRCPYCGTPNLVGGAGGDVKR